MRRRWQANTWDIDQAVQRFSRAYRPLGGRKPEPPVKRYADLTRPPALTRIGAVLARLLGLN